jgi:hypothetical protein
MNTEKYNQFIEYHKNEVLPEQLTDRERRQFIKEANEYYVEGPRLFLKKEDKIIKILKEDEIDSILWMSHNHETSGHFGEEATYNRIKSRFYWKNMKEDIKSYVKACDTCQRRGNTKIPGPLYPIKVGQPFDRIGIDIVGPLPKTDQNNRYIVTAIDYLTKWTEARALEKATAEEVARFIFEDIICRHGCPKIILSDRGTHFVNKIITSLCERFMIKHKLSTPYHPQTNGMVERFNRTLCETLAKISEKDNQWDFHLSAALFAYRTNKQNTTKFTPFYLIYGRDVILPIDDLTTSQDEDNQHQNLMKRTYEIIDTLEDVRREALNNIEQSQSKQKERFDSKLKKKKSFNIGDKVLLKDSAKEKQWSGKLDPKWKGPYYIHKIIGQGAYQLRTIDGQILKVPSNIINLKSYNDRSEWEPKIYLNTLDSSFLTLESD